jgi:hypothetical protein
MIGSVYIFYEEEITQIIERVSEGCGQYGSGRLSTRTASRYAASNMR